MNTKGDDLKINKGVELMLRREKGEPETRGFTEHKIFSLLGKRFSLKVEFTWE